MLNEKDLADVVDAWRTAGRELGLEVVAPFVFMVGGRTHQCLAWVPNFSHQRGIVVAGTAPPDFWTDAQLAKDAASEGYGFSAVNVVCYKRYDRERFIETLTEWGFTGPSEKRPKWLTETG